MEQDLYNGIFHTNIDRLDKVIAEYPWFSAARIQKSAVTGQQDGMLALGLLTKPWPAVLLHGAPLFVSDATEPTAVSEPTVHDEIIDRFLASGDKRIVPGESTPDDDVAEGSSVFVPEEGMDTEELARIYREQGLDRMADEVSELVEDTLPEEV